MSDDPEDDVKAISTLISVLTPLDTDARVRVLEFVFKKLGISLPGVLPAPSPGFGAVKTNSAPQIPPAPTPSGHADIRSFAAEKSPKTVNEKVAVIGYYLAHLAPESERRDSLISEDIKTYFIQAGFQLPTAPPNMTLAHAKNAGYLNALDRGQYKLNAVGYNLVAHKLPGGATAEKKRRTTKKSATKRSAKPKTRPRARK